jgi:hypothetical protein
MGKEKTKRKLTSRIDWWCWWNKVNKRSQKLQTCNFSKQLTKEIWEWKGLKTKPFSLLTIYRVSS